MSTQHAATIIANNYVAYARVLTDSFLAHHPEGRIFVLVADKPHPGITWDNERFTVVRLEDLEIPQLTEMSFQYSRLEFCTAVKPWLLSYLLTQERLKEVIYLDPDILVTGSLAPLFAKLSQHDVLLTPHLTEPAALDVERSILRAGTYNLGFLGLQNSEITHRLLAWWQARLLTHCTARGSELFVDQRWFDVVPGMFPGVAVERDPAYNVAYWNVGARGLTGVRFFHFSGFEPRQTRRLSRQEPVVPLPRGSALAQLAAQYRARLTQAGYEETRTLSYAFGTFDNGQPIDESLRAWYRELGESRARFGNPFQTRDKHTVYAHSPAAFRGSRLRRAWEARARFPGYVRAVKFVRRRIGEERFHRLIAWLGLPPEDGVRRSRILPPAYQLPHGRGVNVIGHLAAESGIGTLARAGVAAARAAGIPVSETPLQRYAVDLVYVNADHVPRWQEEYQAKFGPAAYTVGYWAWELSRFPSRWQGSFDAFDEIWTSSTFSAQAISERSPVLVRVMPPAVSLASDTFLTRRSLALPEGHFLFLFMFDFFSEFERKNPLAVVAAFRQAFTASDPVHLVIKYINGHEDRASERRLRAAMRGVAGTLLPSSMTRHEVDSLLAAGDAYVSLHRAEGFGFTLAEAMALGKPVIATNYSGNTDFMNEGNSFPVGFHLTKLPRDFGPGQEYARGNVWAEPDLDEAAAWMRYVYEHKNSPEVVERAQRAAQTIAEQLSPDSAGAKMKERLEQIFRAVRV